MYGSEFGGGNRAWRMGDSQKTAAVKVVAVKEDLRGKRELVELVEVQTAMGMRPQSAGLGPNLLGPRRPDW